MLQVKTELCLQFTRTIYSNEMMLVNRVVPYPIKYLKQNILKLYLKNYRSDINECQPDLVFMELVSIKLTDTFALVMLVTSEKTVLHAT